MNYRQDLLPLVAKAQEIHAAEREASLKSLDIIGMLDRRRAPPNLGMSVDQFAKHIGLTPDQYLKRVQAAKVIRFFPETRSMLDAGELQISHLAAMSANLTQANRKVVFEHVKGKSKREVVLFMKRVTPDGFLRAEEETQDLRLTLTKAQMELFERAREVLAAGGKVPGSAEIFEKSLEDLLNKRDPLRKAERAAVRADKKGQQAAAPGQRPETGVRGAVPAGVRHEVWLRDQGRCTHHFPGGQRCDQRLMLELDHQVMVCHGGDDTAANLALKCRYHNQTAAAAALGEEWYDRKVDAATIGDLLALPDGL